MAILIAVALAAGTVATGCGGNGSDPKTEYVSKADRICALGTFRIGTEARKRFGSAQPAAKEQKEFARSVVVPELRTVLSKLRALAPPEGDRQRVDAIWAALDDAIDTLATTPGLIAEPGTGGAFDRANQLAHDYGFRQCGSS
jgi:hypothetical protein